MIYSALNVSSKPLDFELAYDSRPHPFKMFEELELQNLTNTDKAIYRECLIESKNNVALAYYLFKNNDLGRSLRASAKGCFRKFIKAYGNF